MAFGRISGPLLKSNLTRDGVDLAFENNLVYLRVTDSDPANHKVGIKNDNPLYTLDVGGTVNATTVLANSAYVTTNLYAGAVYDNNSRVATVAGGISQFATATTTDIVEGTNLYFTTARARASVSATGSIHYDSSTGIFTYVQGNTDTVSEGATNKYYTDTRARAAISVSGDLAYNSATGVISYTHGNTDTVSEGTNNLYFTTTRARAAISGTGSINYSSTTGIISYTQGNTDTVSEGTTNKYYTDTRARAAISVSGDLAYNSATGVISYTHGNTDTVSEGTTNLYFTTARARASLSASGSINYNSVTGAFTYTQGNTDTVSEGTTNKYYTDTRARSAISVSGDLAYNATTGVISYTHGNTDTVSEGTTNKYYTDTRARAAISTVVTTTAGLTASASLTYNSTTGVVTFNSNTDNIAEGTTNKYYTDTRARSAISVSGDLAYNSATGVISYTHGNTDTVSEGTTNLYFTTARARTSISGTGSINYSSTTGIISYTQGNTDTVSEGTTNKYYTDTRARLAISVSGDLAYNSATGVISYTHGNTDTVSEGSSNLYFTTARARSSISGGTGISYSNTTGVISSTITQYTDAMAVSANTTAIATAKSEAISTAATDATTKANTAETNAKSYADTKVAAIVASSPAALDTLYELAAALGNDANFSTTIATTIGTKLATADFASTFDTRLATKTTNDLVEGTNLYFTTARARTSISSSSSSLVYNDTTGIFSLNLGTISSQNSNNVTITGGAISGVTIGASTGTFSGQLTSTVTTGTAPLVIASTTLVTNLNADLLDGQHGVYYSTANNLTGTIPQGVLDTSTLYVGTTAISLARLSAAQPLTGITSVTLPGSTSGSIQIVPSSVAGTGTTLTLPATSGTIITSGDAGTVSNTMLAGAIPNSKLANSSITVGTTAISLGASSLTLTGLTSVAATTFTGALTGNASTATKLAATKNINGVAFDGSADITITADASTLSGTTLKSSVVNSSLTSVGTLTNLSVTNTITGSVSGNAGTVTNGVYVTGSYADPAWISSLAYSKLTGAPTLATVATTGSYTDLTNKPVFSADKLTSGQYTASLSSTDGSLRIPGKIKVSGGGSYALYQSWNSSGDYARGDIKTHPTLNNVIIATVSGSWSQAAIDGFASLSNTATGLTVSTEASSTVSPASITNISYSSGVYTITFNQSINTGLTNWNVDGFFFTVPGSTSIWQFDTSGHLTFPDTTVQSTAWTGSFSYNNLTNKPTLYTDTNARAAISAATGAAGTTYTAGVDYSIPGFEITGNNTLTVTTANWIHSADRIAITSLQIGRQLIVSMPLAAGGVGTSIVTIAGGWGIGSTQYTVSVTTSVPVSNFYAYTVAVLPPSNPLSYDSSTGVFTFTTPNSDAIAEGTTHLYFTNSRVVAALPNQTGNQTKFLTNDGAGNLSWNAGFSGDYNALYNKPTLTSIADFTFTNNVLSIANSTPVYSSPTDFQGTASYWGGMSGNELHIVVPGPYNGTGQSNAVMAALDALSTNSVITITDGTHIKAITIGFAGWTTQHQFGGTDPVFGTYYVWVCQTVETNTHNFSWFNNITAYSLGNNGIGANSWTFSNSLTFPDQTVQSTAWLGTYSYNDLTNTPTLYSSAYIGTTLLDFTRSSASQTLTGVSVTGNAGTVTNGVYTTDTSTVTNTMLAGGIVNNKLVNSSITINGTTISLGGTASVSNEYALTLGTGLKFAIGTLYNGSAARAISIDNTSVATLSDTQTIYNKTLHTTWFCDASDQTKKFAFDLTNVGHGSSLSLIVPAQGGTLITFDGSGNVNLPAASIANSKLVNSTITINGTAVSLGGSITVSGGGGGGTTVNPLTVGTGLTLDVGTTFDGSASRTISIATNVVTTAAAQTLTNKTINGSSNTLSNISNAALTNSAITINGTSVSLGGSISGLATTAALASSFITINGSNITLGNGISGLAATANNLTQFATTTSTELASIISGKTGTGSLVFASVSGTPTTGQALLWSGSTWAPGNVSASISSYSIDALSDVDTTTIAPTIGQALTWNGTKWIPSTVSGSGSGATGGGEARVLDTITPDGSTSTFELKYGGVAVSPTSGASLIVTVDGVYQIPESAYNVIGSIITFAGALDLGSVVSIVEQGGAATLSHLTDVNLSTLTDGQALVWNAIAGKWVNGSGGFFEGSTTVVSASTVAADTFSAATYSTAKYLLQATAGSEIHSTELTVIHNGTTAYAMEYGAVYTSELFTVDATLVSGNVLVNVTTTVGNTTIDFKRVSIISRLPSGLSGDLLTLSGTEDLASGTGSVDLTA